MKPNLAPVKDSGATASKKVFIVEDHPVFREGLVQIINGEGDLMVCGEAGDAEQALRSIPGLKPDLVLVDISLPGKSGLELIKELRARSGGVKLLVLSMHDEALYAERVLRAGARCYVMKKETTKKIISAIQHVLQGKLWVSDQMTAAFAEKFVGGQQGASESLIEHLSDRELEVFNLLGRGLETRKVAETLNVSIKTVQAYCARIKEKLKLANATELLRAAMHWDENQPGS